MLKVLIAGLVAATVVATAVRSIIAGRARKPGGEGDDRNVPSLGTLGPLGPIGPGPAGDEPRTD